MNKNLAIVPYHGGRVRRRTFLADCGMGFTGLVLGAMLQRDGTPAARADEVWRPPDGKPHFPPRAKSVIWIFMQGGVSRVDTFDPKPALNKYAGMTIGETPYKGVLDSPFVKKNVVQFTMDTRKLMTTVFPMQAGYRKRGQSGPEGYKEEQQREFEFLDRLNRLNAIQYPQDPILRARVKSYELAFRMQTAVPELLRFSDESAETQKLYGLDRDETRSFGQVCLTA